MNAEKLRRVADRLLDEPARYDQSSYFCGTTACIAGHACLEAGATIINTFQDLVKAVDGNVYTAKNLAIKELELTELEAQKLFRGDRTTWPARFREAYNRAPAHSPERACAAAAAIENFIETNGWEGQ